jgi:hypothetical protein
MSKQLDPARPFRVRVPLEVVPERPERSAVIVRPDGRHPMFLGEGSTDFACGGCGVVLGQALEPGFVRRLLLVCPACGSLNRSAEGTAA